MSSIRPANADVAVALRDFNAESVFYCRSILDGDVREFAMDYAKMLRQRAKGVECDWTWFSADSFEPGQTKLIKATLDKLYRRHFGTYYVMSTLP